MINQNDFVCERCGARGEENFQKRGPSENGRQRTRCKKCGKFNTVGESKKEDESSYTFASDGYRAQVTAEVQATEEEIKDPDTLIRLLNIDTSIWRLDRFKVGKSSAYRKDRQVDWLVSDGKVVHGQVHDTGKLLVKPMFSVQVWMSRKTEEIRTELALEDFKTNAYKFAPKQVRLTYPKLKKGMLYEVEMPDIHIGKLTWGEESGEDSDIKIQTENARSVIDSLLSHSQHYPIERIMFPIGHDYFNVDNQQNSTSHGTPQQEDTRWRKTFKLGWQLASEMINMCAQVAPVDVLVIPGNHDEERSFFLGEVLSALYSNSKAVSVDNSPKARKYYLYGKNLVGLTHGYHEKLSKLKDVMSYEVPEMWAASKHREWHTGDKHHKEDYVHKTHETDYGVVIRVLRSLTPADTWHYNKGYIGALRASEAFLWDKEDGVVAQFTATPK